VPVEGDSDRRLCGLGELDRNEGFIAKRRFRAETSTDVFGKHPHLAGVELEPLGDLRLEVGHALGRDMNGQLVAIEAGDRRMRLEAGVLLDCGPERALEQQRIAFGASLVDCAARGFFLLREGGARSTNIAGPRRRRSRAFAGVGLLPLTFGEKDRGVGFARGVRSDHARQDLVVELDRGQCRKRRLAIDRGDRFADELDHAVVVEEGNGRGDAG
jgi:hypothetical protein